MKRTRRAVWIFGLLALLAIVDYFAYPYGSYLSGTDSNRGNDGLWLRYTWYSGERSDAEVEAMAQRLRKERIRYAYFHVRSLNMVGGLEHRFAASIALTSRIRLLAPGVKSIAWIYVSGKTDLANAAVRSRAVDQAKWLVQECGFDGVQWDCEPCLSGDMGFLKLLTETRVAVPGAFISVAAPTWFPWPFGGYGWSPDYFRDVESRSDQIAVMGYDTGFATPRSYVWLIAQQRRHIPRLATCQVLMGVPTYVAGGPSHNARAENLRMALKAVRDSGGFDGVAIFADYTTTQADWDWYERAWLRASSR